MGCCSSTATYAGPLRDPCREAQWEGDDTFSTGLEVGGIPLDWFVTHFGSLGEDEQDEVVRRVVAEAEQFGAFTGPTLLASAGTDSANAGCFSPPGGNPKREGSNQPRISYHRSVRVGTLSWNVGGISDHRKDAGAGIDPKARKDTLQVLSAAVEKMGRADVVVVGLQEIISLTPTNAMKATSSHKHGGGQRHGHGSYGHPETVMQWVDLLLSAVNKVFSWGCAHHDKNGASIPEVGSSGGLQRTLSVGGESCTYALHGSPVYLFGMLLCVFCRTDLLRSIKDFAMAEKAMDGRFRGRFQSGAKGVVACRFVLFDRSFCFINCHLSATTTKDEKTSLKSFEQRRKQIQRIWDEVKFISHVDQMVYPVKAHRAVFLLGDTNMRLRRRAFGASNMRDFHQQTTEALENFESEAYGSLWRCDELRRELTGEGQADEARASSLRISRRAIHVSSSHVMTLPKPLSIWQEPAISAQPGGNALPPFPPTFKLAVPGPGYSKKRVPAWTDRVLYRSLHVRPAAYGSCRQAEVLQPPRNISDHDPVFARFDVGCTSINPRNLGMLIRDVQRAFRRPPTNGCVGESDGREVLDQALAFRAAVADAAHGGVEDFSRHVFDALLELGSVDELQAGATQVLECQEELWRLIGMRMELQLAEAIRRSVACRVRADAADAAPRSEMDPTGTTRSRYSSASYYSVSSDVTASTLVGVTPPRQGAGGGGPQAARVLDAGALSAALREIAAELRGPVPASPREVDCHSRMVQRI